MAHRPSLSNLSLTAGFIVLLGGSYGGLVAWGASVSSGLLSGGLAVAYLGLLLFLFDEDTLYQKRLQWKHLLAVLFELYLAVFLVEVGLRGVVRLPHDSYSVLPPSLRKEFHPVPGVMPGISGVSIYSTQETGIRGDPYSRRGYNILAIGGSTTEAVYLDDSEAWPYLLQRMLGETAEGQPVWVGNVGRSGLHSAEYVYVLRYLVPQFKFDAVIVMPGANDMDAVLLDPDYTLPDPTDPDITPILLNATFYSVPQTDKPISEDLVSLALAKQALGQEVEPPPAVEVQDEAGLAYIELRELRQEAPMLLTQLPDLSNALDQYERNLVALVSEANRQEVRLILVTQPAIWSDHLSEEGESLLWTGIYGDREAPSGRYSPEVLIQAMRLFNRRVFDVCAVYGVECVDLAGPMSGNEMYFYDDVHFNELGSRVEAEYLAAYLGQRAPFAEE